MTVKKNKKGRVMGKAWKISTMVGVMVLASEMPAIAQSEAGDSGSLASNSGHPADIVVTARRKEERNLDVPVAISVISAESLRSQRIKSFVDVGLSAPGLNVVRNTNDSGSANFSIRGQGVSSGYGSGSAVLAYLNEVPVGSLATPLYDLASVQVFKGPQGTLFGGTSSGGAVLLTTARPNLEKAEGYIQASIGNYSSREIQGALNLPIADWLAVRVAGDVIRRDGFVKVLNIPGLRMSAAHSNSLRVSARVEPTDWLTSDTIFSYDYSNTTGVGNTITAIDEQPKCGGLAARLHISCLYGLTAVQTEFAAQLARGPFEIQLTPAPEGANLRDHVRRLRKSQSVTNITAITLSDAITFRNLFGYSWTSRLSPRIIGANDTDGSIFQGFYQSYSYANGGSPSSQISNEAQILASVPGTFDLIVGGYLQNSDIAGDVVGTIYSGALAFKTGPTLSSWTKERALFAQTTLRGEAVGLEGVSLTVGGRSSWLRAAANIGRAPLAGGENRTSENVFTYNLSLEYKPASNLLFYIAHRKGFKPGGSNGVGSIAPPANAVDYQTYKGETVKDIEFGAKASFESGIMQGTANLAIYRQDFRNAQRNLSLSSFSALTVNAQSATIKGIEFSSALKLDESLEFSTSYAHVSPKFREYLSPNFGNGSLTTPVTFSDLRSSHFYGTARHTFTLNASYDLPILPQARGRMKLSGTYYYQSAVWDTDQNLNLPQAKNPGFGLGKLRLDWLEVGGSGLDVAVFVDNITNKAYRIGGTASPLRERGFKVSQYGDPRTYGAEVRYSF